MAEELLRSKHAFGALENVLDAISSGKIDAYDILFLKDANGKPYIGWLDKNNQPVIIENEKEIITVTTLPSAGEIGKIYIYGSDGYFWNGTEFINLCKPTDVTVLENELAKLRANIEEINTDIEGLNSEIAKKADIKEVKAVYKPIKYEITSKPEGTLVDYRDKEIRVMCPENTKWVKQSVGGTGNANMYYMAFKAYAPEGAVSFKEGDRGEIIDEMFTFDSDFAGTDEFGRNYSICWLALASYNESSDTWTYFGKNSTTEKFIGWTYVVEWYNEDGVVIDSDSIRINLSNEKCHSSIEPYYILNVNAEVDAKIEESVLESKKYTDEKIETIIEYMTIVEF